MNIWALDKDMNIKHLLLMLAERFPQGSYEILDNPQDDTRSIRLLNPLSPEIQLYLYTFGQTENYYGVDVEYPNLQETNYSDTLETRENVSFDNLVDMIVTNLGIQTSG